MLVCIPPNNLLKTSQSGSYFDMLINGKRREMEMLLGNPVTAKNLTTSWELSKA